MPGVSRNTICPRSSVKMPRILFRVVWGLSDMIATFLPTTWFISVDFPTLGRPISATNPDLWLMLEFLPAEGVGQQLFRSEEHTSELQSRENLVCRLLLEKKKKYICCTAST